MAINKQYVSDIDVVLREFKSTHPLSDSQTAEINKHAAIFKQRDQATLPTTTRDPLFDDHND
jgi:hypothetical protein